MTYPDDEVVFQTSQALLEDGTWAIPGIDRRTAEDPGRPTGSFGVAPGTDGRTYGFFGHGLSVVALPMVAWGNRLAETAPPKWRYAVRTDLFAFYPRNQANDWPRITVNFTNVFITAFAVVGFGLWMVALGFSQRVAMAMALTYGLGTSAWPYTSTFLSEPLSALMLVSAALLISRTHTHGFGTRAGRRTSIASGIVAGLSVHVHVLNVIALPVLFGWALFPLWREGGVPTLRARRTQWLPAVIAGLAGVVLLLLDQGLRFGNPFETGRYDHYGHTVWPFEAAAAFLVAPGRSFFLYSPPLLLALVGWRRLHRRDPALSWMLIAIVASRTLFVATRSDWYGGWGIGARYLVPVIPFALVPLAELFRDARRIRAKLALLATVIVSALFQAWLAFHAIFEHMWWLAVREGREHYYAISHWRASASPIAGFWELDREPLALLGKGQFKDAMGAAHLDAMSFGALRLGVLGDEWGLFRVFAKVGVVGGLAAVALIVWWWRTRPRAPDESS